jgi:hypothetical protein
MTTNLIDIQAQLKKELEVQRSQLEASVALSGNSKINLANKMFALPDGSKNQGPLNCIVLDWRYSRTYFPDDFNSADKKPPICSALDKNEANLAPYPSSEDIQSETCTPCWANAWGSKYPDNHNSRTKACKNTIILAVIPADEPPTEDTTPWIISLPPTSIKAFTEFVTNLQNESTLMPCQVSVDLSMDPKQSYSKIEYSNIRPHKILTDVLRIRAEAQTILDNDS